MGNLGETLTEELTCETVFSIGGIGISESVVVTWIIMAVFLLAAFLLTRTFFRVCSDLDTGHQRGNRWRRGKALCILPDFGPDLSWNRQPDRYPGI